ncbi:MAG TPA: SH3 domain-containing protein [Telluria sp.]
MPILSFAPAWLVAACAGAALVLTLVLAAFLTPRHWWRRANARALAVLAVGTALFTALFLLGAQSWLPKPPPMPLPLALAAPLPTAIHTYRVFDDLNLRAASGTGAARIAVVPGGTLVTTTGRIDGDWWEVTASVDGRAVTGWASSLWLRRDDERRVR